MHAAYAHVFGHPHVVIKVTQSEEMHVTLGAFVMLTAVLIVTLFHHDNRNGLWTKSGEAKKRCGASPAA